MLKKANKNKIRLKRHARLRHTLKGTAEAPRLCVTRSTTNIYAQIIDDTKGITLCSANTLQADVKALVEGKNKVEAAKIVGIELGKKAIEAGIKVVVFDRGGYIYTGRVAALADGAREAGLDF